MIIYSLLSYWKNKLLLMNNYFLFLDYLLFQSKINLFKELIISILNITFRILIILFILVCLLRKLIFFLNQKISYQD